MFNHRLESKFIHETCPTLYAIFSKLSPINTHTDPSARQSFVQNVNKGYMADLLSELDAHLDLYAPLVRVPSWSRESDGSSIHAGILMTGFTPYAAG